MALGISFLVTAYRSAREPATPRFRERVRRITLAVILSTVAFEFFTDASFADDPPARATNRTLQTVAESSSFHNSATYAELVAFCTELATKHPSVQLLSIGPSAEGRAIPALVLGASPAEKPANEVREESHEVSTFPGAASRDVATRRGGHLPIPAERDPALLRPLRAGDDDRAIVLMVGGIHGDQCEATESLLATTRDLAGLPDAERRNRPLLVIIPRLNVDGAERRGPHHRPEAPIPTEVGRRVNAQEIDLNDDFLDLRAPESRHLVHLLHRWSPDFLISLQSATDREQSTPLRLHFPAHPKIPPRIRQWRNEGSVAQLLAQLRRHGLTDSPPPATNGTPAESQTNTNTAAREKVSAQPLIEYAALRGIAAISGEIALRIPYAQRIETGNRFLDLAMSWSESRQEDLGEGGDQGAAPPSMDSDGELPFAYLLPRQQSRLADRLLMHGIHVQQTVETTTLSVEVDRITERKRIELEVDESAIGNASGAARNGLVGTFYQSETERDSRKETLESGTFAVLMDQPLANLISVILEPQSESGWLARGLFRGIGDQVGEDFAVWQIPGPVTGWSIERVESVEPREKLTLDMIYGPRERREFGTPPPTVRWLPGESHYLRQLENRWMRVSAESGAVQPWYDPASIEKVLLQSALLAPDDARKWAGDLGRLVPRQLSPQGDAVVFSHARDLYYVRLDATEARRLTHAPDEEKYATFSPDGRRVAFVRKHDLHVVDVATGTERPLTTDGNEDHLYGELDWVYQEEIYGRGEFRAFWWSPDSRRLALLVIDQSQVHPHAIADHLAFEQTLEVTRYPKAGATLPSVRLATVEAAGGELTWISLPRQGAEDLLVVRVGWTPDSRSIVYQLQGREQTWLELLLADPAAGTSRRLLREESTAWVDVLDEPHWLDDGTFLWLSQRDGQTRLYRVNPNAGDLRMISTADAGSSESGEKKESADAARGDGDSDASAIALTPGGLEIRHLHGISKDAQWAYVSGLAADSVAEQVLAVNLADNLVDDVLRTLTTDSGFHAAQFSADMKFFVDTQSRMHQTATMHVRQADGSFCHSIVPGSDDDLRYFDLAEPTFHRIPARDGTLLEAALIQPPDFDPSRSYPVLCYVYGGPQAPTVRDRWSGATYLWHQMLAQQGILVWLCDNRASSQRGPSSAWPIHGRLGEVELRDVEDGVHWLHGQPGVDRDRIAIWGWSYGGYLTSYAMTRSKYFRAGIAGAPVTDWHNYDAVYTERLMRMPQNNPEGYRDASAVVGAAKLQGRLLLIHGDADDNVHLGNTLQLVDALHREGKQFDLMIYPRSLHGVTQPERLRHLRGMMTDFLRQQLRILEK